PPGGAPGQEEPPGPDRLRPADPDRRYGERRGGLRCPGERYPGDRDPAGHAAPAAEAAQSHGGGGVDAHLADRLRRRPEGARPHPPPPPEDEIGRASCRERENIPGVYETIKKKRIRGNIRQYRYRRYDTP